MHRLIGGSATRAILAAFFSLVLVKLACSAEPNWFDKQYTELAKKYNIEIVLTEPEFPAEKAFAGRQADRKSVETYWALFSAEWTLYPPELVKQSKLKRISFCQDLSREGQPIGGWGGGYGQRNELFLDVKKVRWSRLLTRALIHHEFFHVMDRQMHVNAGERFGLADPRWEALNAPGFKYGTGGLSAVGDPANHVLDHKLKGFINKYSQSDVAEDKANLFAGMIMFGQILDERAKTDTVLAAKIARMKELVKELCPQADEEFWKAARKVSRPGA